MTCASRSGIANAKPAELNGLLERGAFKVILREEMPTDGNCVTRSISS